MRQGLWRQLCTQYRVVVPSVVVHTETRYLDNVPGRLTPIFLEDEVSAGLIEEYQGSDAEIGETLRRWPADIIERADAGELEALTYLRLTGTRGVAFLAADGPAIQAAVALQCGESAMSLEALFRVTGCPRSGLERKYTDAFVQHHRQRGVGHLLTAISHAVPQSKGKGRKKR